MFKPDVQFIGWFRSNREIIILGYCFAFGSRWLGLDRADTFLQLKHMSPAGFIGNGVVLGRILVSKSRPRCEVARLDGL